MSIQVNKLLALSLYHGRNTPNEQLDGWGFDGEIITNIGIGWTYGSIKLLGLNENGECVDMEVLPMVEDMVYFNGKYYGDFEILSMNDPLVNNPDWVKIDFATAQAIINKK
jgi:hypothetical protein